MTKQKPNPALENWRLIGRNYAEEHLTMDFADSSVACKEHLRTSIVQWYKSHVVDSLHGPTNVGVQSANAELGRRYDVNKSQIGRWKKTNAEQLKLQSFCIVAAADNIQFDDGVHAAIHGYISVYAFVFDMLQGLPPYAKRELLSEDVVSLYLLCRSRAWFQAKWESDKVSLTSAVRKIEYGVQRYLGDPNFRCSESSLDLMLKHYSRVWAMIESLIEYDWYGLE